MTLDIEKCPLSVLDGLILDYTHELFSSGQTKLSVKYTGVLIKRP